MPPLPTDQMIFYDRDNGRAEVILRSSSAFFVIWRDAAGPWADGSKGTPFSPQDLYDNFWVLSGREAALLTREALAAVPSPNPIPSPLKGSVPSVLRR